MTAVERTRARALSLLDEMKEGDSIIVARVSHLEGGGCAMKVVSHARVEAMISLAIGLLESAGTHAVDPEFKASADEALSALQDVFENHERRNLLDA